jgi:hypothetical protein
MNDVPAANEETDERDRALRRLRRHVLAYATVICALFLINLLTPGPWWFLWPMFGWGVALAAHWLYVKSVHIDEVWAQRRTEDIRLQAHDLGHIEDIARRHERAEARRRSGTGPPDKNHIETVREHYENLASRSKEKHPGEDDAAPESDETSENRS